MIEHAECHQQLFRTLRFRKCGLHGDADACCRDAGEGKQLHAEETVTMCCLLISVLIVVIRRTNEASLV